MNPETEKFQFVLSMGAVEERVWNGPFFEFRCGWRGIYGECLQLALQYSVVNVRESILGRIAGVVNFFGKSHQIELCPNSKAWVKKSADAASPSAPA